MALMREYVHRERRFPPWCSERCRCCRPNRARPPRRRRGTRPSWGAARPSPCRCPTARARPGAACDPCGRAGCRPFPPSPPGRAPPLRGRPRNTCSPGSIQGTPRTRGTSSRTPRPTNPSLRMSIAPAGAVRGDRAIRLSVEERAVEGHVAEGVDVAVPVVVIVETDVVLGEAHGSRSDIHVGQHRHVVLGRLEARRCPPRSAGAG